MFKILACLLAVGSALAAPGPANKIASDLQSRLQAGQQANIIVSFSAGTSAALQSINSARFANRESRLNALHSILVQNAETSQRGVLQHLKSQSNVEFKSFWISNQIFVRNADHALVHSIAEDPQVSAVDEEIIAHLIEPVEKEKVTLFQDDVSWGVAKIQAPEAWLEMGGQNGNGVVIATLDTGVRGTHEALRDNYVGDYGWFDPSTAELLPTDRNGHGTHTTGTIVGKNGIGVAPGAKWSACRGCATSACSQSDLIACGEFFACPTLADGTNQDCSKAPNLVSNSWGGGRGATWYNPVIEAWQAAGIIPLFSIGGSGPSCNTANSPGDNQYVIGVGSTTIDDAISTFSSVGPTTDGRLKPEIAAPGSNIVSAWIEADDSYASLSGTSMAVPHAAGTVALLQTRNKNLSYDEAKNLLGNADQDLQFGGTVCDGIPDNVFPNHIFGSGRINALKSVRAQTETIQN